MVAGRWEAPGGVLEGWDFLAARAPGADDARGLVPAGALVRLVRCVEGRVRVRVRHRVGARPDYARRGARWRPAGEGGALAEEGSGLWLAADGARPVVEDGTAVAAAELEAGRELAVVLPTTGRGAGR
ncbi:hypothetical protein RM780_26950 [Streptomyces sp. DSM 44917]|uniref:MoeA C-terminal domain-containing protein n=1 Tax=Streptomyces boetiae TaxID=3075541 RepID=A0ABU2LH39_9ACTN|nr:hypothetical protein [Streptomyces sp. DSM 44917]MDT0310558.1 hypothetical protein [Streptomyces sp. DSM 44917]